MTGKPHFPRHFALEIAKELIRELSPYCERIEVAGSLRREKALVGDIEILYVSKIGIEKDGLFDERKIALADQALDVLLMNGVISTRKNAKGSRVWGEKNKLAIHNQSGMPVDFFATTEPCWFNYLVCRTGSADTNREIAASALRRGLHWHPYGPGFTDGMGAWHCVRSEQDVFSLVGLNYVEPKER